MVETAAGRRRLPNGSGGSEAEAYARGLSRSEGPGLLLDPLSLDRERARVRVDGPLTSILSPGGGEEGDSAAPTVIPSAARDLSLSGRRPRWG